MRQLNLRVLAALAVTLILAGCGLTDPYSRQDPATTSASTSTSTTSTTTTATAPNADPGPERGGTIPNAAQAAQNKPAAGGSSPTPHAAVKRYANLDINWTANTVAGVQKQLAAISIGEARAQALQAAVSYGHDSTLQASHVANTGTVIAIAPGQGVAAGWWVVVTRETTTGQGNYAGLPPTDHVTDAQVQHTRNGWVISSWSPQS
jgi:predicted small lipoprotein YifL